MAMVVRILHEGQYDVGAESLDELNTLDQEAFDAVAEGNEAGFRQVFGRILTLVREQGKPLGVEDLRPSELILPAPDSTMDEVRSLFTEAGLLHSA
jgi:hypothetical protein